MLFTGIALGTTASATTPLSQGADAAGSVAQDARVPLAPDTGHWVVLATFVHSDPKQSKTLLSIGDQPAIMTGVGQQLDPATVLRAIHPHRIVIERNGQLGALPLVRRSGSSAGHTTGSGVAVQIATVTAPAMNDVDGLHQLCTDPLLQATLNESQREELAALGACATD